MKHLRKFNENNMGHLPFKNDLLARESTIGKYEFYVDGSTGWGITFPSGWLEVEQGPHDSTGFMTGEINGIPVQARAQDVPRIPDQYWQGKMSNRQLESIFDRAISRYDQIARKPFRFRM